MGEAGVDVLQQRELGQRGVEHSEPFGQDICIGTTRRHRASTSKARRRNGAVSRYSARAAI